MEVPYDLSVTVIAFVASLSPIATVLLVSILHHVDDDVDSHDDDRRQHRHLQIEEECIVKSTQLQSELEIWNAVMVTSIISGSVALLCLVLYELFRRDPIVRKYCYDRKRLTQPDRSPPPLMTSRSLWRGYDDDSENNHHHTRCRSSCGKVCPAILELVFLNLSKQYVQYSRAANEARIEREKRGVYTCCRTDWYHRNCCRSNYGQSHGEEEGFVTDEDGYTFYPGYVFGYSHIYKANTLTYSLGNKRKSTTNPSYPALGNSDDPENVEARLPKTVLDLFPEDDPRQYFATIQARSTRTLLNSLMTFDPYEIRADSNSIESDTDDVANDENEELGVDGELKPTDTTIAGDSSKGLHDETADRVITSTLSSLDDNEQSDSNDRGDSIQQTRIDDGGNVTSRNGSAKVDESNSQIDNVDDSVRSLDLGYPYRYKYILLPPGFHTWEDVTEFLADFFFIASISRWCRNVQSQIPMLSPTSGRIPVDSLPSPGKELEEGEKELLRCAGLDTYLLVRSARFGFDVTFYPFLVSCVAVLPIYKVHDVEAGGTGNAYFNLTIEAIPNGSKTMIWIVVITILLYIYIMRRLWIEWEGKSSGSL